MDFTQMIVPSREADFVELARLGLLDNECMTSCSIEGCKKKILARGWCSAHYNAWRAHGDPLTNLYKVKAASTHCPEGHEYTKRGEGRRCQKCRQWKATQAWRLLRWTERQFMEALAAQNNACGICGVVFSLGPRGLKSPCLDHCHATDMPRGIVCDRCNKGLGHFEDDPDRLERAAAYLRQPKMERAYA